MGPMDDQERIQIFLDGGPFAVVGASTDRAKYGNKVLRSYLQAEREVHPVHHRETEVEGLPAFSDLQSVPAALHGASIITPPAVTERVVEDAARAGVKHLWMQPGAESEVAVARAKELGMSVIAGGPCILVALGFRD